MGDKIVNTTPDLVYCTSARKLVVGPNLEETLLFVVEVFISELTVVNIYIVSFPLLFLLRSSVSTVDLIVFYFIIIILSYSQVKMKQIKNASCNRLEDQVDSGVLGQVGAELFSQAIFSFLSPNSLGIMFMETKVSFITS